MGDKQKKYFPEPEEFLSKTIQPSEQEVQGAYEQQRLEAVRQESNQYRREFLKTTQPSLITPATEEWEASFTGQSTTPVAFKGLEPPSTRPQEQTGPLARPPVRSFTVEESRASKGEDVFKDASEWERVVREAPKAADDRPFTAFQPTPQWFRSMRKSQGLLVPPGPGELPPVTYKDEDLPRGIYSEPKDAYGQLVSRIAQVESGGDPRAKAKTSTAAGLFQFTEKTWLSLVDRHFSDEIRGKSRKDILDMRYNPQMSHKVLNEALFEYTSFLRSKDLPVTNSSIYAVHFLGAMGAAKLYSAPDDALVRNVLGSKVVEANKHLKGKTIGDLKAWIERKMEP